MATLNGLELKEFEEKKENGITVQSGIFFLEGKPEAVWSGSPNNGECMICKADPKLSVQKLSGVLNSQAVMGNDCNGNPVVISFMNALIDMAKAENKWEEKNGEDSDGLYPVFIIYRPEGKVTWMTLQEPLEEASEEEECIEGLKMLLASNEKFSSDTVFFMPFFKKEDFSVGEPIGRENFLE